MKKKICLPSAYDLTLGKTSICRVSDLEHSAILLTDPHTRSSLWFKNEKKQNRLPSVRDLALDKPWLCQVRDCGHSANLHRTQPWPHTHAHTCPHTRSQPPAPLSRQPPAPLPRRAHACRRHHARASRTPHARTSYRLPMPGPHVPPPAPHPRMPRSSGCHRSSRSAAPLSARGIMRAAAPLSRSSKRPS